MKLASVRITVLIMIVQISVNTCYCVTVGVLSILSKIRANNDMGHPLCSNLRDGDWMMDYMSGRLKTFRGTAAVSIEHEFE